MNKAPSKYRYWPDNLVQPPDVAVLDGFDVALHLRL